MSDPDGSDLVPCPQAPQERDLPPAVVGAVGPDYVRQLVGQSEQLLDVLCPSGPDPPRRDSSFGSGDPAPGWSFASTTSDLGPQTSYTRWSAGPHRWCYSRFVAMGSRDVWSLVELSSFERVPEGLSFCDGVGCRG